MSFRPNRDLGERYIDFETRKGEILPLSSEKVRPRWLDFSSGLFERIKNFGLSARVYDDSLNSQIEKVEIMILYAD
jgi:hypothetical protein